VFYQTSPHFFFFSNLKFCYKETDFGEILLHLLQGQEKGSKTGISIKISKKKTADRKAKFKIENAKQ